MDSHLSGFQNQEGVVVFNNIQEKSFAKLLKKTNFTQKREEVFFIVIATSITNFFSSFKSF